jgi:O-antigen ligase
MPFRVRVGTLARRLASAIAVCLAAVAVGGGLAHGGVAAGVAILIATGLLLALTVTQLGFRAITVWVVLTGVTTPFLRYPQQHAVVTFNRAWIPLLAIGLLGTTARPPRTKATAWLAATLGLVVISFGLRALFTYQARRYSLEVWVDAMLLPAMLYSAARRRVTDADHLRRLCGAFMLAGVTLALLTLAERFIGFELATRSGGTVVVDPSIGIRFSGPFAQPDMLAVVLLICLAMTLCSVQLRARPFILPLGVGAILIELGGIWLTYFRGAWIAAIVVIVVSLGLRRGRHGRLLGFASLAVVLGVVGFSQFSSSDSTISSRLNNTQNISGRFATYEQGITLFSRHPLAGVGVGQFTTAEQSVETVRVGGVRAVSTAHNSYLDILAEQGLLGIIPFILLSIAIWNLVHQLSRRARGRPDVLFAASIVAAALAYLIMAMEETTVVQAAPNAFFALCLGMGAARVDLLQEEARSRTQNHHSMRGGTSSEAGTSGS